MSSWTEKVAEYPSIKAAARGLGVPESTLRGRLKKEKIEGPAPELPKNAFVPTAEHFPSTHVDEHGVDVIDMSQGKGVKRFILTSAQNNVDVHEAFLTNLEAFAAVLDAPILISWCLYDRTGYKGVVHRGDAGLGKRDIWFDRRTEPYATNTRVRLAKRLAFCGELDILATAKNPLSSLEAYCGRSSIVVPHNKFAFQCVESRKHQMPKEMFTTGSVTKPKFIQRKAGQLAQFHHVLGALLVEVTESGHWHVHHLNADEDGSFYWLDKYVADGRVQENEWRLAGLILGDIHIEKKDQAALDLTLEIISEFQPEAVVLHDLIDFRSRNHHNRNDPVFKLRMMNEGATVEWEITLAARLLKQVEEAGAGEVVVARGNHDIAFDRWLKETDWRDDPVNAEFYLRMAHLMVLAAEQNLPFNALEEAVCRSRSFPNGARFLELDESFEVYGIECGMHGHVGPNGARGNPKQFKRLGFKSFTAHTHSPSIYDGAYTVGVTGSLDMEYNVGPSKWLQCHGLIYPNGKRAFLFLKNGKYRA